MNQNCINELMNKPTTGARVNETLVWRLFRAAARDIHIRLAILRLHGPRRHIDVYIEKADIMYNLAKEKNADTRDDSRYFERLL